MLKKILYPLDLEGTSLRNRIDGELHTIGRDRYRAFAVNYGFFYAASVTVKDRGTGKLLTRGVDFELLYFSKEITAMTMGKKEVSGVICITNENVGTDLEVGYNLVGGHYANYSSAIEEAIRLLELDNRNIYWKDVLERPDLFQPTPHAHDIGDVYGFEYIIDLLGYIVNAIMIGDNAVNNQILAAITKLRTDLIAAHEAHLADKGNPHGTTAEQVNAYTKEAVDAFLASIGKRFDDLEPRFQVIATALTGITNRLTANEASLEGYGQRLGQAELNISRLFAQIGTAAEDIEVVNTAIDAINAEITALKAKDVNLQSQLTNHAAEIAAIKVVNSNQDARLAAIEAKNVQQDSTLGTHTTQITDLSNRFANYVPWSSVNQGQTWGEILNKIPIINSAGVMEFGKYQDWHDTGASNDYTLREMVQYNSSVGGYEIYSTGFYNCIDVFIRSDLRDKTDVKTLKPAEAARIMREIGNGIRYRLQGRGGVTAGLPAQQVLKSYPEGVTETVIDKVTGELRLNLRQGALSGLLFSAWGYIDQALSKTSRQVAKQGKSIKTIEDQLGLVMKRLNIK